MMRRLIMALVFVLGLPASSADAQTFDVMIGGTNYTVTGLGIGVSFDDVVANFGLTTLTGTPWWGSLTLAQNFAQAVRDVGGPQTFSADYAYSATTPGSPGGVYNSVVFASTTSTVFPDTLINSGNFTTSTTTRSSAPIQLFTTSELASIPEVDGAALVKALFILFTFGLWLRLRRAQAVSASI